MRAERDVSVIITVNGESRRATVPARTLLVHFLRDNLGLTGTHVGCDTTQCGACTVDLDGVAVKSCTVLAAQADGHEVTTIEGLTDNSNTGAGAEAGAEAGTGAGSEGRAGAGSEGRTESESEGRVSAGGDAEAGIGARAGSGGRGGGLHPVQRAFWREHGLQCGYCTPGMIMAVRQLLADNPDPGDGEIRAGLAGNICRCTGYQNIVAAARTAAKLLAAAPGQPPRPPGAPSGRPPRTPVNDGRGA